MTEDPTDYEELIKKLEYAAVDEQARPLEDGAWTYDLLREAAEAIKRLTRNNPANI